MRSILFFTLLLSTLGVYSQTQPSLPSGTVPYSTNLYRATDGSIWTGKSGSYTNLGNKKYVDSLSNLGYTNEMIDSIALYNYDRARNRANHTGTQAQSTVVNLVSDLAGKENISNKVTSLSSPNDTTYPTTKAVSDAISNIPSSSSLQDVTDNGNKTSNIIQITGNGNTDINTESLGLFHVPSTGSYIANVMGATVKGMMQFSESSVSITSGSGTQLLLREETGSITGSMFTTRVGGLNAEEDEDFVTLGQLNDSLTNHSGGGVQTLQQVTDEGNQSTNSLYISGSDNTPGGSPVGLIVRGRKAGISGWNGLSARGDGGLLQGSLEFTDSQVYLGKSSTADLKIITNLGSGNYAEFSVPVKGPDAVNGDEFVTKDQLDFASSKEIYSSSETLIGEWLGEPLYRKVIDIGNLPNNTTKAVAHGIINVAGQVTKTYGIARNINNAMSFPITESGSDAVIDLSISNTNVNITTTDDFSNFSGYVIIEYTLVSPE